MLFSAGCECKPDINNCLPVLELATPTDPNSTVTLNTSGETFQWNDLTGSWELVLCDPCDLVGLDLSNSGVGIGLTTLDLFTLNDLECLCFIDLSGNNVANLNFGSIPLCANWKIDLSDNSLTCEEVLAYIQQLYDMATTGPNLGQGCLCLTGNVDWNTANCACILEILNKVCELEKMGVCVEIDEPNYLASGCETNCSGALISACASGCLIVGC